jgi:hypothetical protein
MSTESTSADGARTTTNTPEVATRRVDDVPAPETAPDPAADRLLAQSPADAAALPAQAPAGDAGVPLEGVAANASAAIDGLVDAGPTATYILMSNTAMFMSTPSADDGVPPTTWLVRTTTFFHNRAIDG